jgi:hypothetical protein
MQKEDSASSGETPPPPPPTPSAAVPFAWQPLTFRGVAAFARASVSRVLLVQLIVALLAAATVVWFLRTAWFPPVRAAIAQLPNEGQISRQELRLARRPVLPLAENRFLSISLVPDPPGPRTRFADVQIEFRKQDWQVCSLLGCLMIRYSPTWTIQVSRPELEPWWGAWQTTLLVLSAAAVVVALLLSWLVLASCYFPIARLVAYYADRELTWGGSWRLAAAALLPGALLLTFALVLYGEAVLDLVRLALFAALHLVVGWLYLAVSPLTLPRVLSQTPMSGNPFAEPPQSNEGAVGE